MIPLVPHRVVFGFLLLASSCVWPAACSAPAENSSRPRIFEDLGRWSRPVSTRSREAQRWFDQGLALTFAFNHDEAIRSYQEAARLDPSCAMAWWGIAYCHGPHINNAAMTPEKSAAAWEAVQKAAAASPNASPVEQALIGALARRYAADPAADRAPLDRAYAAAMREAWKAHRRDADVGALFAESLMDLHPWDLWTHDGEAKEDTPEIVETLEAVLAMAPEHPGANHFYIHAVEASPRPERAVAAADRLTTLVPGAGHLVHMPAHIYVRVGRFADASRANEEAMRVDRAYRALSPDQGFYRVYMAHNPHFLAFSSMMEGREKAALAAARALIADIPADLSEADAASMDAFLPIETQVFLRFGRWEEILRVPEPPPHLPMTAAYRHFARGSALAALGRGDEAERELLALREGTARLADDKIWANNKAKEVLGVGARVLEGEIAAAAGRLEDAARILSEAAVLEDALTYDEPPDWMQPARHTLGAVLLRARLAREAEAVYRQDLVRFPENGWSLWGLKRALEMRGAAEEASEVARRFDQAWKRADVKLDTTCFCLPGI
ncbi:MAG: hypothetical protein ACKVXR_00750 [Planctomycetota bacterium]